MNIAIQPPANQPSDAIPIEDFVSTNPPQVGFTEAFLRFAVQVLDDALQRAEGTDVLPPLRYSFEEQVAAEWVASNPAKLEPYRPSKREGAAQSTIDALVYELRTTGKTRPDYLSQLTSKQRKDVLQRLDALRGKYPAITDAVIVQVGRGI